MVFGTGNLRPFEQNTYITPTVNPVPGLCVLQDNNRALCTTMSETGQSLAKETLLDNIPRTVYPHHNIELEALSNQTPIDIQYMLDHLPEPDVTEQRHRKSVTQGLILHAQHNYLSMPTDIEKGKTIGPNFILNGSTYSQGCPPFSVNLLSKGSGDGRISGSDRYRFRGRLTS